MVGGWKLLYLFRDISLAHQTCKGRSCQVHFRSMGELVVGSGVGRTSHYSPELATIKIPSSLLFMSSEATSNISTAESPNA